jgi:hypothetical protein
MTVIRVKDDFCHDWNVDGCLMIQIANSYFQESIESKLSKIGFSKKNRLAKNFQKGICQDHRPIENTSNKD